MKVNNVITNKVGKHRFIGFSLFLHLKNCSRNETFKPEPCTNFFFVIKTSHGHENNSTYPCT